MPSGIVSDKFHGSVKFGLTTASDEYIRAFGHKPFGRGESYAAAAPGYEGDFT